jgi:manganese transport protein
VSALSPVRPATLRVPGWLKLLGPAFAVSIGYIDPGNWASDLAAGAYRYSLLWVIVAANAIAIVMQVAVTRVTIATGEDFATLIARRWKRWSPGFWFAFQGAVIATDLAEFTGIVLGAELLFNLTLTWSVVFGLVVVGLLLLTAGRRMRLFDVAMLLAIAAISFVYVDLLAAVHPDAGAVLRGAVIPQIKDAGALVIVVAIIGATVMPHNLFLHSWLVKKRCEGTAPAQRRGYERFYLKETLVALNIAALLNGAILIVGASLHGHPASIQDAFAALGTSGAVSLSQLFGAALLVSGIAASTTATLSGDSIVAAFSPVRISPTLRRSVAVIPAAALLLLHVDATALLLWSQTALCLILPIALVPLAALLFRVEIEKRARPARSLFSMMVVATTLCIAVDAVLLYQTF